MTLFGFAHFCLVIMPYFYRIIRTLRWTVTVLMFHWPWFGLQYILLFFFVYMLPALHRRPLLPNSLFGIAHLTGGLCGMSFWHSGNLPGSVCYCTVLHICCFGGGSTGQWWRGGPFLQFLVFSGGSSAWGCFCSLGLGSGTPGLFGCLDALSGALLLVAL